MSKWAKIEDGWYTYIAPGGDSVGVALEKDGLWHVYVTGDRPSSDYAHA